MFSLVNARKELITASKTTGGLLERRPGSLERFNREFTIIRKYFVIFGSLTISMLLNAVFGCGFSYRSCLVVVSQYL